MYLDRASQLDFEMLFIPSVAAVPLLTACYMWILNRSCWSKIMPRYRALLDGCMIVVRIDTVAFIEYCLLHIK